MPPCKVNHCPYNAVRGRSMCAWDRDRIVVKNGLRNRRKIAACEKYQDYMDSCTKRKYNSIAPPMFEPSLAPRARKTTPQKEKEKEKEQEEEEQEEDEQQEEEAADTCFDDDDSCFVGDATDTATDTDDTGDSTKQREVARFVTAFHSYLNNVTTQNRNEDKTVTKFMRSMTAYSKYLLQTNKTKGTYTLTPYTHTHTHTRTHAHRRAWVHFGVKTVSRRSVRTGSFALYKRSFVCSSRKSEVVGKVPRFQK